MAHVRNRYPRSLLFAAGWSLGANIMTRYLGGLLCLWRMPLLARPAGWKPCGPRLCKWGFIAGVYGRVNSRGCWH